MTSPIYRAPFNLPHLLAADSINMRYYLLYFTWGRYPFLWRVSTACTNALDKFHTLLSA
jgi:hypothetical protein